MINAMQAIKMRQPSSVIDDMREEAMVIIVKKICNHAKINKSDFMSKSTDDKGNTNYTVDAIPSYDYLLDNSKIFDENKISMGINDHLFRKRYFILILIEIVSEFVEITDSQEVLLIKDGKSSQTERVKRSIDYDIEIIDKFEDKFLNGGKYRKYLYEIYKMIVMRKVDDTSIDSTIPDTIIDKINEIRGVKLSDGIMMNELMKLSYMISTNSIDIKDAALIKSKYKPRSFKIVNELYGLGKMIDNDWNTNGVPLFCSIFMDAGPNQFSIRKNIDDAVMISVYMLQLIDLMVDDYDIHNIICNMIL